MDSFIIALYGLAEYYSSAKLHDKMIRDHKMLDLRDTRLSEKLQLDPELMLEKAVTQVPGTASQSHTAAAITRVGNQ